MGIDLSVFITYVGTIILIFVFGKIFMWPIKAVCKLAVNSILGGIFIAFFNMIAGAFEITIPLNILNAVIVGILGLPGAIMLLILT